MLLCEDGRPVGLIDGMVTNDATISRSYVRERLPCVTRRRLAVDFRLLRAS
ncbi:MAG: hypothetical protein ACLUNV_06245 [Sutterella wadsworthensis]